MANLTGMQHRFLVKSIIKVEEFLAKNKNYKIKHFLAVEDNQLNFFLILSNYCFLENIVKLHSKTFIINFAL